MRRSGGRAGRPFGHLSIDQLEVAVQSNHGDGTELMSILGELGFRHSRRASELKSLVERLLRAKTDDDLRATN